MDQARAEPQPRASVYANASPLIALARIDRLDLLRILPLPVHVTDEVWQEIAADRERPGAQRLLAAAEDGFIAIVDEGNPADDPLLDPGEASILSAARVAGGAVLIDERKARTVLETDPVLKDAVPYLTTTAGEFEIRISWLSEVRRRDHRWPGVVGQVVARACGDGVNACATERVQTC